MDTFLEQKVKIHKLDCLGFLNIVDHCFGMLQKGPLFYKLGRLLCVYMLTLCSVFLFQCQQQTSKKWLLLRTKIPFYCLLPLFTFTCVPKMSHSIKTSFHGGACVTICVSLHYRCIFAGVEKKTMLLQHPKKWFSTKDHHHLIVCGVHRIARMTILQKKTSESDKKMSSKCSVM